MSLLSGIAGALGGFAAGGPLGGLAGAIGGFGAGGKDARTTTQEVQLRELTPQQRYVLDRAFELWGENLERMTPENEEALRAELFKASYDPQARAIRSTYADIGGKQDALLGRRGMLDSSEARAAVNDRVSREASDLGTAASNATLTAESLYSNRLRDNLAVNSSLMGGIQAIGNYQNLGATTKVTGPDTTWQDIAGSLGYAAGSDRSWWNTGGKDKVAGWFS